MQAFRGISQEKATGLAAIENNRHWLIPVADSVDTATLTAGIVGGVPGGGTAPMAVATYQKGVSGSPDDRKLVSTSSFDLLVKHPAEAAERIRSLTQRVGGFLVKSQTNGAQDATSASIVVRVPAARFAEVAAEVRKLGVRVENEEMQSEDMTRQYVDQQAHLGNLRAQEAQYLSILKQSRTVKDTLEVSEKLNGVRGEIERQQAEFETLSRQVETVAVSVSLHSEAQAQFLECLGGLRTNSNSRSRRDSKDWPTTRLPCWGLCSICRPFCCGSRRFFWVLRWAGNCSAWGLACCSERSRRESFNAPSR